jgi:hypothetical protein
LIGVGCLCLLPTALLATTDAELDDSLRLWISNFDDLHPDFQEAMRALERSIRGVEADPMEVQLMGDFPFPPDPGDPEPEEPDPPPASPPPPILIDTDCMPFGHLGENEKDYGTWFWDLYPRPSSSDLVFDEFGDGVPNLLNYVLGTHPSTNSRQCLPRTYLKEYEGTIYLGVTFLRPKFLLGERIILETSSDLMQWEQQCGNILLTEPLPTEYPQNYERVWLLDKKPYDEEERRFLRLRATELWGGQDPTLAQRLAGNLLAKNPGMVIDDVRYSGAWYASDCFNRGNAHGLEIDEGVVITTGFASEWNRRDKRASWPWGLPWQVVSNDPQLEEWMEEESLWEEPSYSLDAQVLEIDFTPEYDRISLRFLFASEEYYEGDEARNDAMGIFVGRWVGNSIEWQTNAGVRGNIGILPETVSPAVPDTNSRAIAVFNVGQVVNLYDPRVPLENYMHWFVNNSKYEEHHPGYDPQNDPPLPPHDVTYSGFTVAFDAVASVFPNEKNIIRIVLADEGDNFFDAAVFLEKASFRSFPQE